MTSIVFLIVYLVIVLAAIDIRAKYFPDIRKQWPYSSGVTIAIFSGISASIMPVFSLVLVIAYTCYSIYVKKSRK